MDPAPEVMRFYARSAQNWLDLEMPGVAVAFRPPDCLRVGEGFELQLLPGDSRWQLRQLQGRAWLPFPASRPCLSLVDWLAQVRKVHNLTDKAGTTGSQTESETQI